MCQKIKHWLLVKLSTPETWGTDSMPAEVEKRLAGMKADVDQPSDSQLQLWAVRNSMIETRWLFMDMDWMMIGRWSWKCVRVKSQV